MIVSSFVPYRITVLYKKMAKPRKRSGSLFWLSSAIALVILVSLLICYWSLRDGIIGRISQDFFYLQTTLAPKSWAKTTDDKGAISAIDLTRGPSGITEVTQISNELSKEKPFQSPDSDAKKEIDNKMKLEAERKLRYDFKNMEKKAKGAFDMHFIHIPKCGGTSMTAILREVACSVDPDRNADCCLNPGFCDWHAQRRCASIKGCINHFAHRPWILKKEVPSITIMREPVSRLISAWFYRGHSPNNDFFQVRPYFKDIRDGKLPKIVYSEYIEMPEYQNIQTRMLGADSFPYRNVTITEEIFRLAKEAVDELFFVGLQEVYELSVLVLLRELNMGHLNISIVKERDQGDRQMRTRKQELKSNQVLMARTAEVNAYDVALYELAKQKFCKALQKYPDLVEKSKSTKLICPNDK